MIGKTKSTNYWLHNWYIKSLMVTNLISSTITSIRLTCSVKMVIKHKEFENYNM
jgi:hypothetical protein